MSYRVIHSLFKDDPRSALVASCRILWSETIDPIAKITAFSLLPTSGTMEAALALNLDNSTALLKALEEPLAVQESEFNRIGNMAQDYRQPPLFRLLAPTNVKLRMAFLRQKAKLAAAIAAIAAERYRKRHGQWPNALADLVPAEMKQLESDPFTGGSLLMRRLSDGLVIYSVGSNRQDDGGTITAKTGEPLDIGFRLWDVAQRGLEPKMDAVKPGER